MGAPGVASLPLASPECSRGDLSARVQASTPPGLISGIHAAEVRFDIARSRRLHVPCKISSTFVPRARFAVALCAECPSLLSSVTLSALVPFEKQCREARVASDRRFLCLQHCVRNDHTFDVPWQTTRARRGHARFSMKWKVQLARSCHDQLSIFEWMLHALAVSGAIVARMAASGIVSSQTPSD